MPTHRLQLKLASKALGAWVLTDQQGIPRFWSTIWADVLRANLKDSTRSRHLYAIERLYKHFERQDINNQLDCLLTESRLDEIESGLTGFLATLRNRAAHDEVDTSSVWSAALSFVLDVTRHISARSDSLRIVLEARLLRLDSLYAQIAPCQPARPASIRALPSIVVADLYQIFDPTSSRNPFRTDFLKQRNYLIFLLLMTMGLRRGEIAILPLDAIKSDFDLDVGKEFYWINVAANPYEDDDARYDVPGIKNTQSQRQLPISQQVLIAWERLAGYRNATGITHLLASQKKKPLSLRSIQRVLEVASKTLSSSAMKALENHSSEGITPHDLRHTCAVYRLTRYLKAGSDLDTSMDKLRVFFGWSAASNMPRHYARAYFESDAADVWSDNYETFVDALRGVEGQH